MKLIPTTVQGKTLGYSFWCPACEELHYYRTVGIGVVWDFNGDIAAPTFSPSWRRIGGNECHFYVNAGRIQYAGDAKHSFAGKTVPMVDLDPQTGRPVMSDSFTTVNGKPITTGEQAAANLRNPGIDATATSKGIVVNVPSTTHRPECGDVGETGEHGDLGSNAK